MKKSRRFILTVTMLMMILMLTGCDYEQDIVINSDLTSLTNANIWTTEEDEQILYTQLKLDSAYSSFKEFMEESGFVYKGKEQRKNEEHNYYNLNVTKNASETKAMFTELTTEYMVYDNNGTEGDGFIASDANYYDDNIKLITNITFPFNVAMTNGELQPDGRTVSFDMSTLHKIYAFSATALNEANNIKVTGVKNNKAYKKPITITVETPNLVDYIKLNGKEVDTNIIEVLSDGKYTLEVKSLTGAVKSYKFCIDGKKPTTNIKNNKTYKKAVKITFKDKLSGIKKATLNGKKIKNNKKVSKNGKYTLKITDKAGNKKTIKFKINK